MCMISGWKCTSRYLYHYHHSRYDKSVYNMTLEYQVYNTTNAASYDISLCCEICSYYHPAQKSMT